jgi:hypothetical protein
MKERRERVMGDFQADATTAPDPLDYAIQERFRAERHPEQSVDGDSRWEFDLFDEGEGL